MMSKIGRLIATTDLKVSKTSVTNQSARQSRTTKKPEKATALGGLHVALKIEQLFEMIDDNHNGYIESNEFVAGLRALPGIFDIILSNGETLDEERLRSLVPIIDVK